MVFAEICRFEKDHNLLSALGYDRKRVLTTATGFAQMQFSFLLLELECISYIPVLVNPKWNWNLMLWFPLIENQEWDNNGFPAVKSWKLYFKCWLHPVSIPVCTKISCIISYQVIFTFKEGDHLAVNLVKCRAAPHGWFLNNYWIDANSQGLSVLNGLYLCGTRSEFTTHGWCLNNYGIDAISHGLSVLNGLSLCGTRSEFTYYTRSRNKLFLS